MLEGVQYIPIAATDNLKSFTQIIKNVFPESQTQICVVHQIRNAYKYVDRKQFTVRMKPILLYFDKTNCRIDFK